MLFQSSEFLILLLAVLAGVALIRVHALQLAMLLAASMIFYMWWNPVYILLLLFTSLVDYFAGRMLGRTDNAAARKRLVWLSCGTNLAVLALFKYFNFFVDSLNHLFIWSGSGAQISVFKVLLPIGISFYTFESMSYTIDVYRRKLEPQRSVVKYLLFVTYFPHLVAGPILRAAQFMPQLNRVIDLTAENLRLGFAYVIVGLVKKLVIADNIGPLVDSIFNSPQGLPSPVIWIGSLSFAVQLYCDFSGYSDIAIGLGRMLGFNIPANFNFPYLARSMTEFWQRWHITLSNWLRDYVYLALPGSRVNKQKAYINLLVTMTLCGLWHGAGWNFVLFGLSIGTIMVLEWMTGWYRSGRKKRQPAAAGGGEISGAWTAMDILRWGVTMFIVLFNYLLFRVHDVADLWYCVKKFVLFDFDFNLGTWGLAKANPFTAVLLIIGFITFHLISYRVGLLPVWLDRLARWQQTTAYAAATVVLIWFWPAAESAFVYFQF